MGLLDFIFRKKKEHAPKIVLQKYSPLEPYSPPHSPELDKISREAQILSDQYYQVHCSNISSFDYRFVQDTNEKELSCVEKSFLKYVCGRCVLDTYIAGYWTHTYGIDYRAVMSKFFNLGLLSATIDLQSCTVKTLKEVLRKRGLPISGKKADLIARIGGNDSLSPQELDFLEKYRAYTPTEYGSAIISTVLDSATKDTDFEDETLALIQMGRITEAFNKVAKWNASSAVPNGIDIDWTNAELPIYKRNTYEKTLSEHTDRVVASCLILNDMLGLGGDKLVLLLERFNKYTPTFVENKIMFTEEEVKQHEELFFTCLKGALQKEKLTIQTKKLPTGWRFLWHRYQIGQIAFSKYGHLMQWVSGAQVADWDITSKKETVDMTAYVYDTCGETVNADGLNLQECIDKIPYWIQYIHILIKEEDL